MIHWYEHTNLAADPGVDTPEAWTVAVVEFESGDRFQVCTSGTCNGRQAFRARVLPDGAWSDEAATMIGALVTASGEDFEQALAATMVTCRCGRPHEPAEDPDMV